MPYSIPRPAPYQGLSEEIGSRIIFKFTTTKGEQDEIA